jgi:hypothetical protein
MSNKREWAATLFPSGVPFTEMLNDNARFVAKRRERFSTCPEFQDRLSLYRHLAKMIDEPIDYFEFGVWQGASIKEWASLNSHAGSRFFGFDTFEGLPEDWDALHPKGTFSTNGQIPKTDDARIRFTLGLFQDTLRGFIEHTPPKQRLANPEIRKEIDEGLAARGFSVSDVVARAYIEAASEIDAEFSEAAD